MGYYYSPFFYDPTYFLVIIGIVLSLIAQAFVKSTYAKYSKVGSSKGFTAERAAQTVLSSYGIKNVEIARVSGHLTDHYNPQTNVISLSDSVYGKTSIAAIGVACHEAGHAAQHANGYVPIKVRNAFLPVCNIGSSLALPLAVLGLAMGIDGLVAIGLVLYASVAVFQLITLPIEFNASRRALKVIDEAGILYDDERSGARKVLTAAALTYVVALAVSLLNLFRIFLLFGGGRRDD